MSLRIICGPRSALLPILISDQLRHAAAEPKPSAHKSRRSHSQVLHLLPLCLAPVNCRDWCFFSNSVTSTGGYCSNCYTHSIDQGRLPQEIVHICILFVLRWLAHWLTQRPSTPHLSASTLVFLSQSLSHSPSNVFMIARPVASWSRPPLSGICKLASVQLHTRNTRGQ